MVGFLQEAGESRLTVRRYLGFDIAGPTRQADPDRFESRFLAGPQPEKQGVSFPLRGTREHLELIVRADATSETLATADNPLELNVDADLRRGESNHYIVPRITSVEEKPSVREAGLAVLTEEKNHIDRLYTGGPPQNHPQRGSRANETAGGRGNPETLGTAQLLSG